MKEEFQKQNYQKNPPYLLQNYMVLKLHLGFWSSLQNCSKNEIYSLLLFPVHH